MFANNSRTSFFNLKDKSGEKSKNSICIWNFWLEISKKFQKKKLQRDKMGSILRKEVMLH